MRADQTVWSGGARRWFSADDIEARFPPRGHFVKAGAGRMHVISGGRDHAGRAPVVLLHGASGNACDLTLDLFDALAASRQVYSIDRPGHGWSERPGGALDAAPNRQATLVREALGSLGVRSAILVAHSWAGGLALNMALDHRDVVQGVVLVAAATHPWPGGRVSWYNTLAAGPLGAAFTRFTPFAEPLLRSAVERVFQPQEPPPEFIDRSALPLLLRPSQFRANAEDMAGLHGFLTAQAPRYGEIAVPVVSLAAEDDEIVPPAHGLALAERNPRVRLETLRQGGHMLQHVAVEPIRHAVDWVDEQARQADVAARRHRPLAG